MRVGCRSVPSADFELTFVKGIYGLSMIYAVSPFSSATFVAAAAAHPILLGLGKFVLTAPFMYHTFNGVRHLVWDAGHMLSLSGVYTSGYAVLGATALSSLYLSF